jgi:hypothetical protein
LSQNYVRVQALDSLAKAMSAPGNRLMVMPTGKDGLPSYFLPFLNPFGKWMTESPGGSTGGSP